MKFDILEALCHENFDCSTELLDMVGAHWDALDPNNQNMVARYKAAEDGQIVLENMYDRYVG